MAAAAAGAADKLETGCCSRHQIVQTARAGFMQGGENRWRNADVLPHGALSRHCGWQSELLKAASRRIAASLATAALL